MKTSYYNLTCETDYFSAGQDGAVVIFRPKGNRLLASTLINAKQSVLDYFAFAADHSDARILILMPQRKVQRDDYLTFFDMVHSCRVSKSAVMRLYRAIDQIMLHILSSDLFFINVNHGQIMPLFASISMACDFSVIGDDATFPNPALELGLVPKGGMSWFLKQMLGRNKALELMLADKSITADEAIALGLANRCVPVENLEAEALSIARRFEALPETSLRMAKRLVNNASKAFPDYLEYENHELIRSLAPGKMDILNFGQ